MIIQVSIALQNKSLNNQKEVINRKTKETHLSFHQEIKIPKEFQTLKKPKDVIMKINCQAAIGVGIQSITEGRVIGVGK